MDRIAGAGLARDMLEFCEKKRLIRKAGGFYLLNRDVLDKLGIHWEDLGGRKVSDSIATFLNEFRRTK